MSTNDKKRRSIRRKVQTIVTLILALSLLVVCGVGVGSMIWIRNDCEEAMAAATEQGLSNIVDSKSDLANEKLMQYEQTVSSFAAYLTGIYEKPEDYLEQDIPKLDKKNAGKAVLQKTLASDSIREEDVKQEAALDANVEKVLAPVMADKKSPVTTIYFATESGFIISYDKDSDKKPVGTPYNYFESAWYSMAKKSQKVCFTDVYLDGFGRGLTITCAAPFFKKDGSLAGIVGMDILLADLYNETVSLELEKGCAAMLIDNNGHLITPEGDGAALSSDKGMSKKLAKVVLRAEKGILLSDKNVYYVFDTVEETGWKFCVREPASVVLRSVYKINTQIVGTIITFIVVFLVILCIAAVVVQRFAQSLTDPIMSLSNDAKEISGGDLDHKAQVFENDEIGDLAVSFNDMSGSLKKYIEDLTAVTAEKERIGAELNVATQIQADMLPRIFPPFPGRDEFDIYASMTPAKEVGGDFYDFFLVDEDHVGLVMADVSGKGVPAALFMVIAKTLIKNRTQMGGTPSEILEFVNEQLCEGNEAELFVTVWLAIIEISTGKGIAANAGHEHPILRRGTGEFELIKYRHSPAVATIEGIPFREHDFELNPGDTLFVYTDGVTEATNANDELFGEERTVNALNRDANRPARQLVNQVKTDIDAFVAEAQQFDDITMLAFDYYGPGGKDKS